jgi:hypothetical protein
MEPTLHSRWLLFLSLYGNFKIYFELESAAIWTVATWQDVKYIPVFHFFYKISNIDDLDRKFQLDFKILLQINLLWNHLAKLNMTGVVLKWSHFKIVWWSCQWANIATVTINGTCNIYIHNQSKKATFPHQVIKKINTR